MPVKGDGARVAVRCELAPLMEDSTMACRRPHLSFVSALLLMTLAWTAPTFAVPMVTTDSGASVADIQDGVTNFQAALGNPNNGNAAGTTGGRREINWDGGNVNLLDNGPGGTPFNVFLNTRGGQFSTTGSGFVQAPPSGGAQNGLVGQFTNATYATTFAAFSPSRLFVPIGSNEFDAIFFVPGTNGATRATVSGFGVVFSDVDVANTTHMDFFDLANNPLGSFNVPVGGATNASFSFLGVIFTTEQIGRVHVVLGNSALATNANDGVGGVELVAMDDFLFAEPRAVPAPAGLALLIVGGAALGAIAQLRSRRS